MRGQVRNLGILKSRIEAKSTASCMSRCAFHLHTFRNRKCICGVEQTNMKPIAQCFILIVLLGTWTCYKHVSVETSGRIGKQSKDFIFEVTPRVITPGQLALLRWSIKGATHVRIEAESEVGDHLATIGTFGGNGTKPPPTLLVARVRQLIPAPQPRSVCM